MKPKRRLSASVDDDLIRAAEAAAKRGDVPTASAWVNDALRAKLEQEQRLRALASFVDGFEAEHGEMSQTELEQAARRARVRAVTMRATAPVRTTAPVRAGTRGRRKAG
jgi:Arc/MetJ-type ribon-helix-helix transcriptional regulator